jgi:hypothetical protein
MSTSESRNGREADSIPEGGILAALPRARPQRASARRAAARGATAAKSGKTSTAAATAAKLPRTTGEKQPVAAKKRVAAKKPVAEKTVVAKRAGATTKASATTKAAATRKTGTTARTGAAKTAVATGKHAAKPAEPPVPKQGYEPEEELELGKTVQPPSGVELVESVADIVGELANSSLAAGGRLLKDAFSLLRRP